MLTKSLTQSHWKDKKKNIKFYKKRVKSLKLPAFHPCLLSAFLCQTSRLSAVFPQNLIHPFKLLFHLLHQTELGSGPHQIVLRISRLKIYISLKIICQMCIRDSFLPHKSPRDNHGTSLPGHRNHGYAPWHD